MWKWQKTQTRNHLSGNVCKNPCHLNHHTSKKKEKKKIISSWMTQIYFLSIGIISGYTYSSVEAWLSTAFPFTKCDKREKAHSRYYRAVLHEIGSLCKANNVKWGKHQENLTSRLSKHKGVGTVNDFRISGTANTTPPPTCSPIPLTHTHKHVLITQSMQEILAILGVFVRGRSRNSEQMIGDRGPGM